MNIQHFILLKTNMKAWMGAPQQLDLIMFLVFHPDNILGWVFLTQKI